MCIATVLSQDAIGLSQTHSVRPNQGETQMNKETMTSAHNLINLVKANFRAHPPYIPSFAPDAFGRFGEEKDV